MIVPVTAFPAGRGVPHVGQGRLSFGTLEVELHDGTRLSFRLDRVEATLGGASGKMIFLRSLEHGATVSIEAPGFPEALREAAGGALDVPLAAFRKRIRGARHWDRIAFGVLAAIAALVGAFVLSLPRMLRHAVDAVPRSVDRSIGDAVIGSLAPESSVVHDPILDDAVARIVARLEPHVDGEGFAFRFRVLATDDVNAFALPGGQIVVCAGLLARAERPEAVAGVLAHELAHVTRRHALESMAANLGIVLGLRMLFGQIDFLPSYAQDGALLAAMRGFSQEEELDADAVGVGTLLAAGIDPRGLADVFRTLADQPGSEMPGMLAWMSTHPQHDERIARIEALVREAGPRTYAGFDGLDWAAVRSAADRAIRAAPPTPSPFP